MQDQKYLFRKMIEATFTRNAKNIVISSDMLTIDGKLVKLQIKKQFNNLLWDSTRQNLRG